MNPATAPDVAAPGQLPPVHGWPRSRLLWLAVVVFTAHIVLIYTFGARQPPVPRTARELPQLTLVDGQNELLALNDPTLFALPHADEFTPPYEISYAFRLSEPTNWLSLTNTLSAAIGTLAQPALLDIAHLDFKPKPRLSVPQVQIRPDFASTSTLRLDGDLVQRQLVSLPKLPSWIDNDVLQPTVVRVFVDADGDVVSAVLLDLSGSGLPDADQKALEIARGLHFVPATRPTFGAMIFDWHTMPVPATNSPAIAP
jgi:hypothetical protein